MAKRKRADNIQTKPKKRKKGAHPHGNFDPDKEYRLKSIVGENPTENPTEYLIDWESDSETGEKFEKTWEPRANVNQAAIEDWENKKADKKRIQELSGVGNESHSDSEFSTPPAFSRKSSAATRRRRKVIDSSPKLDESPLANSHSRQSPPQANNSIEIGESQQTAPRSETGVDAASPLFVPEEDASASDRQLSDHTNAAVHLSPPPSSYLDGQYQAVPPSQPAPSGFTQESESTPHSEFLPETVDTSKITEDSTEISLDPTTPLQQTLSQAVEVGQSSANIVPDSQSNRASLSFFPSVTGTSSSSAPIFHPPEELDFASSQASAPGQEDVPNSTAPAKSPANHPDREIPDPSDIAKDLHDSTADRDLHSDSENFSIRPESLRDLQPQARQEPALEPEPETTRHEDEVTVVSTANDLPTESEAGTVPDLEIGNQVDVEVEQSDQPQPVTDNSSKASNQLEDFESATEAVSKDRGERPFSTAENGSSGETSEPPSQDIVSIDLEQGERQTAFEEQTSGTPSDGLAKPPESDIERTPAGQLLAPEITTELLEGDSVQQTLLSVDRNQISDVAERENNTARETSLQPSLSVDQDSLQQVVERERERSGTESAELPTPASGQDLQQQRAESSVAIQAQGIERREGGPRDRQDQILESQLLQVTSSESADLNIPGPAGPERRIGPQNQLEGTNQAERTGSRDLLSAARLPASAEQPIEISDSDTPVGDRPDLVHEENLDLTEDSRAIVDTFTPVDRRQPETPQVESLSERRIQVDRANEGPTDQSSAAPGSALPRHREDVAADRVDLTGTQFQSTSISQFSVTPPHRGPRVPEPRHLPSPNFESSNWQGSTFAFLTQPPETVTAGSGSPSPVRTSNSQPLSRDHRNSERLPSSSQPPAQSSPVLTSSPIPPVPSQSIGLDIQAESAPPRPNLYSSSCDSPSANSTMGDSQSHTPRKSLGERIRAMQAEQKATPLPQWKLGSSAAPSQGLSNAIPTSSAASTTTPGVSSTAPRLASPFLRVSERTRSPSAVPAEEPLPVITQEEMNTSERYETLLPQSQDGSSGEELRNGPVTASDKPLRKPASDEDPETANVHAVPIYMVGHQRDQYPNLVYEHKDMIDRYLSSANPSADLTQDAKLFVDRARRIAMHPDLDNFESLTQYAVNPSVQARWDVDCSAKFRFLKELLECLRNKKVLIAIIAKAGRIIDILETFLRGCSISFDRPGVPNSTDRPSVRGDVRVKLLTTNPDEVYNEMADLVIAMDNSVVSNTKQVRALRFHSGKWPPFITLVIPYSVEHVERCLSPTLSDRAWTQAIVSGIDQYHRMAGKPDSGSQVNQKDSASLLAQYVTGAINEWPLPALNTLADLDSQTDSEVDVTANSIDASRTASLGNKRTREPEDMDMDEIDSSKRSRVESPAVGVSLNEPQTINPRDIDITHISDSIEKTTQGASGDAEAGDASPILSPTEKRLQDLLMAAQDSLDEHKKVLSDLQYRFEEQRNELLEVRVERDKAIQTAQQAVNRFSEESNKMSTVKARNTGLEEQLKEANEKLLNHSVPERAEFEALRLTLVQTNAEKEKLEKRIEQLNKDLEYVRDLYQQASSTVQSNATQMAEMENQLAVAQNRATGEQAKLRQMGYDNSTKNLQEENKRLKARNGNLETLLRAKDEEIAKFKEASRGRMGTRGTSVPRSPRIGSPRVGSRQTSPSTGEVRGRGGLLHPLRNAER